MDIGIKYGGAGSGRITNGVITTCTGSTAIPAGNFVTIIGTVATLWDGTGAIDGLTKDDISASVSGEVWILA